MKEMSCVVVVQFEKVKREKKITREGKKKEKDGWRRSERKTLFTTSACVVYVTPEAHKEKERI